VRLRPRDARRAVRREAPSLQPYSRSDSVAALARRVAHAMRNRVAPIVLPSGFRTLRPWERWSRDRRVMRWPHCYPAMSAGVSS
jgi:hypothetical protein